jgi:ketosteroid isomerase-like protein
MSRENVELVRRLYEAIERRDIATVLELYDPEVEADFSQSPYGELTGGTVVYRGHDGIRRLARDWNDAWESVEYSLTNVVDAGEHVISAVTYRGRGRSSGAEVERTDYAVWTVRQRRIIRVIWLLNRSDALKVAGLRE